MSRRISLLTQRTALFLLSPSPVPSFLSPPPFLRLSPSLCLSFSNTTYRHSNSPLPSVQRRYPRPRHRQPLHPRNCGHNVSSRTNDRGYNSAGYGIGKEYRGPRLCEKRDFFFSSPTVTPLPSSNFIPGTCAQSLMRDHLRCYRRQRPSKSF